MSDEFVERLTAATGAMSADAQDEARRSAKRLGISSYEYRYAIKMVALAGEEHQSKETKIALIAAAETAAALAFRMEDQNGSKTPLYMDGYMDGITRTAETLNDGVTQSIEAVDKLDLESEKAELVVKLLDAIRNTAQKLVRDIKETRARFGDLNA